MRDIGGLPDLGQVTATQSRLQPAVLYAVRADVGVAQASASDPCAVAGAELAALQAALVRHDLPALQTACMGSAPALRRLLRELLAYHLGETPLRTRQVLLDLQPLL